jgi:hypothetical protein
VEACRFRGLWWEEDDGVEEEEEFPEDVGRSIKGGEIACVGVCGRGFEYPVKKVVKCREVVVTGSGAE